MRMDNNVQRLENNARRMWPEIALFSIRSSLFSTFATVGTGQKRIMSCEQGRMNIRISLLSDEIRKENAAKKLRMRHKRASTLRQTTGEPASYTTGIEKKAIRTRIMWYENTRIWHERKPRALREWHESNAYLAQKEHIWKHQNGAGK